MNMYDNYKEKLQQICESAKDAGSFKELAENCGLGKKEMQDILNKFPVYYKQLKNKFKDCACGMEEENAIKFPEGKIIVLDTSAIRAKNLIEAMDEAIRDGFKFVLTSITIKELDLKKKELRKSYFERKRMAGINAQKVLAKAIEEEENIIPVCIPEISLNPDDDIIDAIRSNIDNIVLWSGDKAMLLKARMYGISYVCVYDEIVLNQTENKNENLEVEEEADDPIYVGVDEMIQNLMKDIESAETSIQNKKAELDALMNNQKECLPIHEPNASLYKVYMKDGKLYSVGRINPTTTLFEVYDAYGNPKDLKEPLEIGDTALTVMMREDMSSIKIREEQVCRISIRENAYILFSRRIYSIDEEELKQELPDKYFLAVKKFLNN